MQFSLTIKSKRNLWPGSAWTPYIWERLNEDFDSIDDARKVALEIAIEDKCYLAYQIAESVDPFSAAKIWEQTDDDGVLIYKDGAETDAYPKETVAGPVAKRTKEQVRKFKDLLARDLPRLAQNNSYQYKRADGSISHAMPLYRIKKSAKGRKFTAVGWANCGNGPAKTIVYDFIEQAGTNGGGK